MTQPATQSTGCAARVEPLLLADLWPAALRMGDLVSCRAGCALTVCELAAGGRPSLLISLPHAAHRTITRDLPDATLSGSASAAVLMRKHLDRLRCWPSADEHPISQPEDAAKRGSETPPPARPPTLRRRHSCLAWSPPVTLKPSEATSALPEMRRISPLSTLLVSVARACAHRRGVVNLGYEVCSARTSSVLRFTDRLEKLWCRVDMAATPENLANPTFFVVSSAINTSNPGKGLRAIGKARPCTRGRYWLAE